MDLVVSEQKPPTLCLNMIVKNESRIITRLFDSVVSIIDSYCICDTGSTDNTIEIIEEYFKNKQIPGKVVKEPFKNFCYNRTFAMQACVGLSDYVLLVDADMVIEINNFKKSSLRDASSFNILQGNDSFYYNNMRITKNNGLYKYVGVTHEYIDCPPNNTAVNIEKNSIFIRDIGDGGSKENKYERDILLLTEGIKEEPNNVRYHFYLANSYFDIGRTTEAIELYKKRVEFGGWKEEVWYSYYRIGMCYSKIGKFDDALKYWLDGYNFYPERLEGIYEIIKHYRYNSKHKLGILFYKVAKEILDKNENRNSYLFLHNYIYTHQLHYEYSILAAYCGIKNIDNEIVTILNLSKNENENSQLLSNMKFYKNILNNKKQTIIIADNTINTTINGDNFKMNSSSSCLIKNKTGGYLCNIRYVNYYIESNGSYKNCDNYIITMNQFLEIDNSFNVINKQFMDLVFDGRRYMGIEDIKIYYDTYSSNIKFIGTGYHANNTLGISSGIYNTDNYKLEVNELKQTFKNTSCEKNWVFIDYNNETHIIYEWHPLTIGKLDDNNELKIITTKQTPGIFSRLRGSTCGYVYNKQIEVNKQGNVALNIVETEIWFIGHIASYESPRHYYHIISVFDSNMNLLRYSAPFKFEGDPIEYCLSIIVEDDRVLINYSTWDRTTRIGIYDKKDIDEIIKFN